MHLCVPLLAKRRGGQILSAVYVVLESCKYFRHLTVLDCGPSPETTWHVSKVSKEEPGHHYQCVKINGDTSFIVSLV